MMRSTRHSPVSSPKKVLEHCNAARDTSWIKDELAACEFADIRLAKRLSLLRERLSNGIGNTLPLVCQDWANTKAAYRFFSNAPVSEAAILAGHFDSTSKRFAATRGPILVLQDATALCFHRENPKAIGSLFDVTGKTTVDQRSAPLTVCGILMHSSLAVTPEGLPLAWQRLSSGVVASSRAAMRSKGKSIRHAYPSKRK